MCSECVFIFIDPPILLAPQLSHYRAYTTDNISIPCIADSSPVAYIAWFRMEGQESVHISNNTDDPSNIFYLQVKKKHILHNYLMYLSLYYFFIFPEKSDVTKIHLITLVIIILDKIRLYISIFYFPR
jgi:hypothetical protein